MRRRLAAIFIPKECILDESQQLANPLLAAKNLYTFIGNSILFVGSDAYFDNALIFRLGRARAFAFAEVVQEQIRRVAIFRDVCLRQSQKYSKLVQNVLRSMFSATDQLLSCRPALLRRSTGLHFVGS